jgi:hypothetical protein
MTVVDATENPNHSRLRPLREYAEQRTEDRGAISDFMPALNRAMLEIACNWRARWIPNSTGQPRWSFRWLIWTDQPRRPPLYLRESWP